MLLWQHTAAGKHSPLQPFNTIAISLTVLGWKAALFMSGAKNKATSICFEQMFANTKCFMAKKALYFHKHPLEFSISSAYDNHSDMPCVLSFPLFDIYSFREAFPLSYHPMIRPVLPSPLKHDGARHAVVTQWDFFIERRTNTSTQRQTFNDHGTW